MMTTDEAEQAVAQILAEFANGTERQLQQIQAVYDLGFRKGYERGLAEARARRILKACSHIVRSMAAQHFGGACVIRLLDDGQLHVEATSEKNASEDAVIEFKRDLVDVVGRREIVVTARPPGYEPTEFDRKAIDRGVVLT